jgi:alpha-1,2-mannosyltransferase
VNLRSVYGIRRLYEPRFRDRVLLLLLIVAGGYYATWSIVQWITLTPDALRFDFVNYFGGAQAAAQGTDIYADFKRSWGSEAWVVAYIYPPFFAELLAPLTPLGLLAAARIWLVAVHAAFLGSLMLLLRLHPELSAAGRRLFLLGALGFMPVYLNLKFQQVATVWLLLLTAPVWAALRRRETTAGGLIAIAASLKLSPIFLIALFARLGRWRITGAAAAALVGLTGVTLALAPGSWQFFTVVLPRIGLGTANWDNGSIDGLVSRIVQLAPGLLGGATEPLAKALIIGSAVLVIGFTVWQARGAPDQGWTLRLSAGVLVVSLLMVSSVTWQHHLVTLLLPMATALAWITVRRPGARYGWWLFGAYALCWVDRRAFPLPADLQVHSSIDAVLVIAGTSIKLIGLILLWTLLLQMLHRERNQSQRAISRLAQPAAGAAAVEPAA